MFIRQKAVKYGIILYLVKVKMIHNKWQLLIKNYKIKVGKTTTKNKFKCFLKLIKRN